MTAVEYIEEKIKKYPALYFALCLWFDEAKEIEKQQIIKAYDLGSLSDMQYPNPETVIENGEQYYNETFKNK